MRGPLWKIKYPIYPIIRYVIVAPETKSTSGYCQNFEIEKFLSYQLLKFYRRYRRFFFKPTQVSWLFSNVCKTKSSGLLQKKFDICKNRQVNNLQLGVNCPQIIELSWSTGCPTVFRLSILVFWFELIWKKATMWSLELGDFCFPDPSAVFVLKNAGLRSTQYVLSSIS